MGNATTRDSYIAILEQRLSALTAERDSLRSTAERLSSERDTLQRVVEKMQSELRQLRRMLFGRKSERFIPSDPSQLKLDFEGVAQLKEEREYAALQPSAPTVRKEPAPSIKRPTEDRQRRIFSEHLERRDQIIEPDEIPAGGKRIGEEVTELLEYKPGELYIRRLIRPKYALPHGEGVVIGSLPSLPLPRTNAGPSILAQLLVGKYQDHLPLHRRIGIFVRAGVQLKASTVSDWVQGAAELLKPLYECLRKRVLGCDYIQVDESIIPVLDKDKPGAVRKGYHWMVRSPELRSLFFHYDKGSRAQYVVVGLLKDFQGTVQSDGYGAYDIYENKQGVLLLGPCEAQVRACALGGSRTCGVCPPGNRAALRHRAAGERRGAAARSDQSPTGEGGLSAHPGVRAVGGATDRVLHTAVGSGQGRTLCLCALSAHGTLWDGRYRIDNNGAENAVRPLALGRKNYLFCRNHEAAYHTAVVYSLLGTCRLWDMEPLRWLTDVFSRIQDCSVKRLEDLLPHKWRPQQ